MIDERNREYLNIEEQFNKLKQEKNNIEKEIREEFNLKITDLIKSHEKQVKGLIEEIENFQTKYLNKKDEKKAIKLEYENVKAECDRVNLGLYNTIQSYEKREGFKKEI